MNDLFDDLKALKSKMKKDEEDKAPKKALAKSKEQVIREKEEELKADFLEYMKNSEVKKIDV